MGDNAGQKRLALRSTRDRRKISAGCFLLGVWGCPPRFKKSPMIGGYRGLFKIILAVPTLLNGHYMARVSLSYEGVIIRSDRMIQEVC